MPTPASIAPHLFVIFGATGDLTQRKLVPALYQLSAKHGALDACYVLGTARSDWSDDTFRETMQEALSEEAAPSEEAQQWCAEQLFYQGLGEDGEDFEGLKERIEEIEAEHDLPGNRVFYLALPPSIYGSTAEALGAAGLAESEGFTRLVVEKPFGRDLASAQALNETVHARFGEEQVYRIDHYLGKETVQNLLAFRFGNALFASVWNRDRIEHVEITVAEALGVGERAGYYDQAGALRDMVQNHLTQLLCLVAMEPPTAFAAEAIRREKVKVLDSVRPLDPDAAVFGQYTAGEADGERVPAYRDEADVPDDSDTETFVELELEVANWRWEGVPFVLRTGKRLPEKRTQIAVRFQCAPVSIFEPFAGSCAVSPNRLVITLQPDEGFDLFFEVKRPGDGLNLETQRFRFDYADAFGALPGAYQALLHDVLIGDQTLFVRADEVEASWRLYAPLLEAGHTVRPYPAGSEGPEEHPAEAEGEEQDTYRLDGAAGDGVPAQAGPEQTGAAQVRVFSNYEMLSRAAVRRVVELAHEAVAQRGRFTFALSGGSTPRRLYELLAGARGMPWHQTHLFFGDERFVRHTHPESNYHAAADALFRRVALPESHIHGIPTGFSTPERAARAYEEQLRQFFPVDQAPGQDGAASGPAPAPAFDLVLLGLGTDGHTASLFPGDDAGSAESEDRWVRATTAPEGSAVRQRITLTRPVLDAARNVVFLVSGEEKRSTLRAVLHEAPEAAHWPAAQVRPAGTLTWFVDRAAHGAERASAAAR